MCCFFFFFFKQKTAYEMRTRLEFRRVLFRSGSSSRAASYTRARATWTAGRSARSEERREGKSVDLGGRRIIKKKKKKAEKKKEEERKKREKKRKKKGKKRKK